MDYNGPAVNEREKTTINMKNKETYIIDKSLTEYMLRRTGVL